MPKHNRNRKKKNKKPNQKKKQTQHHNKHKTKSKKSKPKHKHTKTHNKTPPNQNRINEDAVIDPNTLNLKLNPTHSDTNTPNALHSPTKLHYYDADISDSDTNHHNTSPNPYHSTLNPRKRFPYSHTPQSSKMQILRSAKISQRNTHNSDSSSDNTRTLTLFTHSPAPILPIPRPILPIKSHSISYLSPAFDSHHKPSLISQHTLSPLPTLHRASSEPITHSSASPQSILRSPHSHSHTSSDSNSHTHVSFKEVEIHEFKLLAGSESDGVPDDGGMSLHLDKAELKCAHLDIESYEKQRYERWTQRAKHLHWNKNKLNRAIANPEKYLYTAGRFDEFYSALTPKEREKRLCIDKRWKREHFQVLNEERMELDKLRRSRKKNNIFCNCKPLSAMGTSELKVIAKAYGIKVYENRKVKKGFLINQLKSKVTNYRDICCWDRVSCTCVSAEIDCHSGTNMGNFQCGCVKYQKKCANDNGRYVYKSPRYAKDLITEWEEFYGANDGNGFENGKEETPRVSFKL